MDSKLLGVPEELDDLTFPFGVSGNASRNVNLKAPHVLRQLRFQEIAQLTARWGWFLRRCKIRYQALISRGVLPGHATVSFTS